MEENLLASAKLANVRQRLLDTNLVVDSHDGDEAGLGPDGLLQILEVDQTVVLHGQICDLKALVLQVSAAVQDALVLRLAGDDVVLLARPLEESRHALDAHVVTLRRSRREDDLLRIRADQLGNVAASLLDGVICLPTVRVRA